MGRRCNRPRLMDLAILASFFSLILHEQVAPGLRRGGFYPIQYQLPFCLVVNLGCCVAHTHRRNLHLLVWPNSCGQPIKWCPLLFGPVYSYPSQLKWHLHHPDGLQRVRFYWSSSSEEWSHQKTSSLNCGEFMGWWGFPGGSDGKESACSAGDPGLIPGLRRSPGGGNGNPLQYSCLENSMDRGAWRATVLGITKSWTRLSDWVVEFAPLLQIGPR